MCTMNHNSASEFLKPTPIRRAALLAMLTTIAFGAGGCGAEKSATTASAPAAPAATAPAAPAATAPAAPVPSSAPEAEASEATPSAAAAPSAPNAPAQSAEAPKDSVKMSKEYWPNGKLKYTYELRKSSNGKWAKNGIGRAYYDSGELEREGPYKNNVRVGKWTYFAPDGKVLRTEERGADGKGGNAGDPPLP
jgi:hypothetical protein